MAFAALAATAQAQSVAAADAPEQVIVTGSRVQGMTAADSAEPVTVVDTNALSQGVGSTDLRQSLGEIVPSFTAQQFGGDTAAFTLVRRPARPLPQRHAGAGERPPPPLFRQPACRFRRLRRRQLVAGHRP